MDQPMDASIGARADEPTGKSENKPASEPRGELTLAPTICC
jgi:hypothetical protein